MHRSIRIFLFLIVGLAFNLIGCAAKKVRPSHDGLKSGESGKFEGLSKQEIIQLTKKAIENPRAPESQMAWLSLASNFLHHLEAAQEAINRLNDVKYGASLGLSSEMAAADPNFDIDRKKLEIEEARSQAQQALDQQRLMLEYGKASDDFINRSNDFYKGMDAQRFDQSMRASTTAVENEGKRIENVKKMIEAQKMLIENEILRSYASAYNSYVRAFHEYSSNMVAVMRGARKISRQAYYLANSLLEYDKRVKKCNSAETRVLNQDMLDAVKNLKISDYSTIAITYENDIRSRVQAVYDLPSGKQCLEMGMIQANLDEFGSSYSTESYTLTHPVFRLPVYTKSKSGSLAARTITACPTKSSENELLKYEDHLNQVDSFTDKLLSVVNSLKEVNTSLTEGESKTDVSTSTTSSEDAVSQTAAEVYEADETIDLGSAVPTEIKRKDGRNLLVPYPATPFQAVMLVNRGHLEFRIPVKPTVYCELEPSGEIDRNRLTSYVQSVRDFENLRLEKLRRDLELEGVKFGSKGKILLNATPFNSGSIDSDDKGRVNSMIRRGFFYAQQCAIQTTKHAEQAGITAGAKAVTLPTPTDVTIGANKYSFFYPPYSLGDDENTLKNQLTKVTRLCVDNALMSLSHSQQALGFASEYAKFFSEAANIKAPAAPIPYIPNPAPGSTVYSR